MLSGAIAAPAACPPLAIIRVLGQEFETDAAPLFATWRNGVQVASFELVLVGPLTNGKVGIISLRL